MDEPRHPLTFFRMGWAKIAATTAVKKNPRKKVRPPAPEDVTFIVQR